MTDEATPLFVNPKVSALPGQVPSAFSATTFRHVTMRNRPPRLAANGKTAGTAVDSLVVSQPPHDNHACLALEIDRLCRSFAALLAGHRRRREVTTIATILGHPRPDCGANAKYSPVRYPTNRRDNQGTARGGIVSAMLAIFSAQLGSLA